MDKSYLDPTHPGGLGGVDAFYRSVGKKVPKKEIQDWLKGVDAYTLHKPVRHKFPTNRVIVYSIDQQWQCDLVDVSNLKRHNKGFRYILTCIDILSKYAWAIPLKSKRGEEVVQAFQKMFQERIPKSIQSDDGGEFKNSKVQKLLRQNGVRFFTTFNNVKASVIERFNRTLKTKMWHYFTSKNTYNYINVLQKLLKSYNHTFHRSIKRSPAEVNPSNESEVWFTLYGDVTSPGPCTFSEGDIVRISKRKMVFEKGYLANWSEELFKVTECVKRTPPVYRIVDLMGEPILGTFYPQELQKVTMKEEFPIEKVLKKRKQNGKLQYFVKFRGYPEKFNQWVDSIQTIKES